MAAILGLEFFAVQSRRLRDLVVLGVKIYGQDSSRVKVDGRCGESGRSKVLVNRPL